MTHKAVHFAVKIKNRGNTSSLVAAAAYRAGTSLFDEQTGLRKNYRSKRDVVSVEMIRAAPDIEAFWNAADRSETRINSRLAREIQVSLPHELPLDTQRRLVRGYCLWLHDTFGMSSMAAIHHPFADSIDKEILEDLVPNTEGNSVRKPSRNDDRGNPLNTHVHILCPTRVWLPDEGRFGAKLRELDDVKTGPEAVQRMRSEWQKRVNAKLEKAGVEERVDLRSYEAMAAAGDAPEGLLVQPKLGARNTARGRKRKAEIGVDDTYAGLERAAIAEHNDALWQSWLMARAAERAKLRKTASVGLASQNEEARKERVRLAAQRLAAAISAGERVTANTDAPHVDTLDPWTSALAWAEAGKDYEFPEVDHPFDPEVDAAVSTTEHARTKVKRVRKHGPRERMIGD